MMVVMLPNLSEEFRRFPTVGPPPTHGLDQRSKRAGVVLKMARGRGSYAGQSRMMHRSFRLSTTFEKNLTTWIFFKCPHQHLIAMTRNGSWFQAIFTNSSILLILSHFF